MADIELVIKIPEEMYKWVNDVNRDFDEYGTSDFIDLVKKGTPLPKGHGDLVDISYFEYYLRDTYIDSISFKRAMSAIKQLPTIIEADTPKIRKGTPLEENDSGYNCENWIP